MRGDAHWTNRYPTARVGRGHHAPTICPAFQKTLRGPEELHPRGVRATSTARPWSRSSRRRSRSWPSAGERPGQRRRRRPRPSTAGLVSWSTRTVNQGRVSIGASAASTRRSDYVPALVMNDILGGGGFSSRLVNRIRSDEGLSPTPVRSVIRAARTTPTRGGACSSPRCARSRSRSRSPWRGDQEDEGHGRQRRGARSVEEQVHQAFPTQFETAGQIAQVLALEDVTGRAARAIRTTSPSSGTASERCRRPT